MAEASKDRQDVRETNPERRLDAEGKVLPVRRGPGDREHALGALAVVATLLLESSRADARQSKLLVFVHLPMTQRALQKVLSDALIGVTVTAVGRVADFDRALSEGQDAVLSLPLVLSSRKISPTLLGYRRGVSDEPYALVGDRTAPDPRKVKVVGALDLLGRAETTAFVHRILDAQPGVERVTKVQDLLALLQMQSADAVVLPLRLVPQVKAMTRMRLVQRELSVRIGLPAASAVGTGAARVIAAIRRLPEEVSRALGVDEWK